MKKRILNLFVAMVMLFNISIFGNAISVSAAEPTTFYYVATDGNNSNPGTIESPFATIEGARDAIRTLKKGSGLPEGGIVVYVRGGNYQVDKDIVFTGEDSGTAESPIVYKAYPGEKPVLNGGIRIPGRAFKRVTDKAVLDRLSNAVAKKKVVAVDLNDYNYGEIAQWSHDDFQGNLTGPMVFINDTSMDIARYPNYTEERIQELLVSGACLQGGAGRQMDKGVIFEYTDDRPETWASLDDVVVGYNDLVYSHNYSLVKNIDLSRKTCETKWGIEYDGNDGATYYWMNVLEELDTENEYYIDRKTGMLYLYPSSDIRMSEATIGVSRHGEKNTDSMVYLKDGASYITFSGFKVELSRANGISMQGAKNCLITNCEVVNHGVCAVGLGARFHNEFSSAAKGIGMAYEHPTYSGWGVRMVTDDEWAKYNVENCGVTNSTIANAGNCALFIAGGDRINLTSGGNFATNNIIHSAGLVNNIRGYVVQLGGYDIYFGNNTVYDGHYIGIYVAGNDIIIERNDIYDVMRTGCDGGAVYSAGWHAENLAGTEIRYNYIHDIHDVVNVTTGSATTDDGVPMRVGVYNDNANVFLNSHHNIFANIPIGNYVASGYANDMTDNIFIDVDIPVIRQSNYLALMGYNDKGSFDTIIGNCEYYMLKDNEAWLEKYPEVNEARELLISRGTDCQYPDDNITNNVIIYNKNRNRYTEQVVRPTYMDETGLKYETIENNLVTRNNIGFVNMNESDYRWKEDAEIFETYPQFKNMDITRYGAGKNELFEKFGNAVTLKVNNPNAVAFGESKLVDSNNPAVKPVIVDSRTLVPVRFISEAFGCEVGWDAETQTVTITKDGKVITMKIGDNNIVIDGANKEIDVPAQIIESRTMVPLRALTESLGKEVFWDNRGLIVISDETDFLNAEADKEVIDDMVEYVSAY